MLPLAGLEEEEKEGASCSVGCSLLSPPEMEAYHWLCHVKRGNNAVLRLAEICVT